MTPRAVSLPNVTYHRTQVFPATPVFPNIEKTCAGAWLQGRGLRDCRPSPLWPRPARPCRKLASFRTMGQASNWLRLAKQPRANWLCLDNVPRPLPPGPRPTRLWRKLASFCAFASRASNLKLLPKLGSFRTMAPRPTPLWPRPIRRLPQIGFVSPRPFGGPIRHNSFSAQHLPFPVAWSKLALFRTIAPSALRG